MHEATATTTVSTRAFRPSDSPRPPATVSESGLLDFLLGPGALSTVFQPIFDLREPTPRAVALECLTRGPKGSSLEAPDLLFGFARRKRATAVVDRAAIATALANAAPLPASLRLHLNVHASTLSSDTGFPHYLQSLATAHGIETSRLVVELVEHADLVDDALFVRSLAALRAQGASVALDDVGHGRSNFRTMLLASPSVLKIDRYLVRGIHQDAIRQAVVLKLGEMARALPAALIAVGIETLEELDVLRELGVEQGQGYLFARPAPAEELRGQAWLLPG